MGRKQGPCFCGSGTGNVYSHTRAVYIYSLRAFDLALSVHKIDINSASTNCLRTRDMPELYIYISA
jgi:hypothetical protein